MTTGPYAMSVTAATPAAGGRSPGRGLAGQLAGQAGWIALVALWSVWIVGAFWWVEFRPLAAARFRAAELAVGAFSPALLDARRLAAAATRAGAVFYFAEPGCGCSSAATEHLDRLVGEYASRGVAFVIVPPPGASAQSAQALRRTAARLDASVVPAELAPALWQGIPAAPAAAVLDPNGAVAYVGPLAPGALCAQGGRGLVEPVLERLLAGEAVQAGTIDTLACVCPTADVHAETHSAAVPT